ncbi:MAG: hypothetical protein CL566_03780 [Alphaproteobacteria bacterium]|nr:hypothetical protein [Alphaproteobacteria bacterium]|tara:strand:- start:397 stop:954 length:558 start_codon:yes stop_codon:yes gene_type:complete
MKLRDIRFGSSALLIALEAVALGGIPPGGAAHAQAAARPAYDLGLAAVECFEVIGKAPEHREIVRRRSGDDPGPTRAFLVRISDSTVADIRATYTDIEPSPHPGFEHFLSSSIRLDVSEDADTSMTQILPRDGYVMFTMSQDVVEEISRLRPRCGARQHIDRQPFEEMHRRVRGTLRQMLDQNRY